LFLPACADQKSRKLSGLRRRARSPHSGRLNLYDYRVADEGNETRQRNVCNAMKASLLLFLLLSALSLSARNSPVDLLFLLDASKGMYDVMPAITTGSRLAALELQPGDRTALMTYSSSTKLRLPWTADMQEIDVAWQQATRRWYRFSDERHLHDALLSAIAFFPNNAEPERRRIIVAITNDVDDGSKRDAESWLRQAKANHIEVWVVLLDNPISPLDPVPGRIRMPAYPDQEQVAAQLLPFVKETGGQVKIRPANGYTLRQTVALCKDAVCTGNCKDKK